MSREQLLEAITRYVQDERFRQTVRERRSDAVAAAGFDLTDEERREIDGLVGRLSDQELLARVGTVECHS